MRRFRITDKTQEVRKIFFQMVMMCHKSVITNIFPIFHIENHMLDDVSSWPIVVHHEPSSNHVLIIFHLAWTDDDNFLLNTQMKAYQIGP